MKGETKVNKGDMEQKRERDREREGEREGWR